MAIYALMGLVEIAAGKPAKLLAQRPPDGRVLVPPRIGQMGCRSKLVGPRFSDDLIFHELPPK
jgi:hypothetical protein